MTRTKTIMISLIAMTVIIGITANYAYAGGAASQVAGTVSDVNGEFYAWDISGASGITTLTIEVVCDDGSFDPTLRVLSPLGQEKFNDDDGINVCFFDSRVVYGPGEVVDGCWVTQVQGFAGEFGDFVLSLSIEPAGNIDPLGIVDSLNFCTPETVEVNVDLKPQSCPNPINVNSKGLVPVAILGTETLDVNDIDISSLPDRTIKHTIEDVAAPFVGLKFDQFDCNELGPDGFDDLIFKIPTDMLNCLPDGVLASLTINGLLLDGTPFEGFDLGFVINKQGC